MHILEQYALSCGVKIGEPYIYDKYYPIPFDKYIAIQPSSGMPSKNYSYFLEVINMIKPYLEKEGISLLQVGGPSDKKIPGIHEALSASINQMAYLVKNSLLYLGTDSCCLHFASFFKKKSVTVSGVLYDQNFYPYWSNKKDYKIISPDVSSKPTFSTKEPFPKRIDFVNPEKVAVETLEMLDIKHNLSSIETLNIGKYYKSQSIEIVPNFFNELLIPDKRTPLNIRMDYEDKASHLNSWLNIYKCHLIINKEESIEEFLKLKNNITKVSILLNKNITENYVSSLVGTGISVDLVCLGEENLKDYQIKFLDYNVIYDKTLSKKDLDSHDKICNNTFFKTSKIIFSNNKTYSSNAHRIENIEKADEQKILDNADFWRDQSYYMIFNT